MLSGGNSSRKTHKIIKTPRYMAELPAFWRQLHDAELQNYNLNLTLIELQAKDGYLLKKLQ